MGPLHDIIFSHPQRLAVACITWVAIAVWVVALIGWMIEGQVDVLFGTLGIAVAFVLGYFSFEPPVEVLRPFVALATVCTVIAFPVLRTALNQRALVAIDVEAIENCYEMLRLKPDNSAQRFKLGRLMYERGVVGPGLAQAAEALHGMPEKFFGEEHRLFARWKRQNPTVDISQPVVCINCGHHNPPVALICERCGQPHLLELARGRWVGRQFAKKVLASWIAGIVAIVGIPLASQFPPVAAIVAILLIMAGAILVIWLAFRQTEEPATA